MKNKPLALESTGLPLMTGPYAGLYLVTRGDGSHFVNYALATTEEDAARIVSRENGHAALVDALKEAETRLTEYRASGYMTGWDLALSKARAALESESLAEAKKGA